MRHNRSESAANSGMAAGRRVNVAPRPVTSQNVRPAWLYTRRALVAVALVVAVVEAARALGMLS